MMENTTLDVNNEYYYDYSSGFKVNFTATTMSYQDLRKSSFIFINTLTQMKTLLKIYDL